jgi:hypothetical protein
MKTITEKQKNEIDLILSGYIYYRNTGKKWSKENLLNEVSCQMSGGLGLEFQEINYNELIKKQYNKEQLATMYVLNKLELL